MNIGLFIVFLFISSSLHAGLIDRWSTIWIGFKNIVIGKSLRQTGSDDLKSAAQEFRKRQEKVMQMRRACSEDLASAAQEFKKRQIQKVRSDSEDALLEEFNKDEFSPFFTASRPDCQLKRGIFNNSHVSGVMRQLEELRTRNQQSDSEKPVKVQEFRELPELGKFEHNNAMNKYFFTFDTNLTSNGRAILRVSLMERSMAMQQKRNRRTGASEDVPCLKKLVKAMIIGTEQENGTFEWRKIVNSRSEQALQEENSTRQVQFNDTPNYQRFMRWNYSEKAKGKTRSSK